MSDWSIIVWCNDRAMLQEYALSFVSGYGQLGGHNVELVPIYPEENCRNMGEAYNRGQERAHHANRIYMHQDVALQDWSALNKLDALLDAPGVGGVGLIGSTVDVGSGYFHSPESTWAGEAANDTWVATWPECQRVQIVDGLFLATREHIDWPTNYHGPHMCIEDACYQLREQGREIWLLDSLYVHRGSTFMDYAFFESLKAFRRRWRHMIPADAPPVAALRARTELALDVAREAVTTIEPTGEVFDDYVRGRIGRLLDQTGRSVIEGPKRQKAN